MTPLATETSAASTAPLTVEDVVKLDEVQVGSPTVVAGSERLQAPVRWVHIAEVADIAKLLRGGELLLTTGIALPEPGSGLAAYVEDLATIGVSGLMIELVRRWRVVPPELVRAAERTGLPVIALEREAPFVAITEAVHAEILARQVSELRVAEEVRRSFQSLATGAPAGDVVRVMSELAQCPVVFENLAHRPLAVARHTLPLEDLLADWETRSRCSDTDEPGWIGQAVQAKGQPCGRVILLADGPENPVHRAVLDFGQEALAVAWLVADTPSSLEEAAQRAIVEDLVHGRCRSISEFYARAKALGSTLSHHPLGVISIRSDPPHCQESLVARELERTRANGVGGQVREDQVLAVVALPEQATDASRWLSAIASGILAGYEGDPSTISIGAARVPDGGGLDGLVHSIADADEAARSMLGSGVRRMVTVDDIELRALLRLLADDARLQRFVARQLHPLWEYDQQHRSRLIDILTVYLECGGNKSTAAARSHLSRAAFYHSLERLTSILQRDLETPAVRTALHVAILASATHS